MSQDNPSPYQSPSPPIIPTGQPPARPIFRPYATYVLIGICVLVYLLQISTKALRGTDIPALWGVKDNGLIMQGQVWRLLTPIFLHSDQTILHIAFNM